MATLVVLNRPFSVSTASFFAALSTASSLRLAACALGRTAGLHPSSRLKPDLETFQSPDTSGRTTFEKPALPNLMARGVEVRTISAARRGLRRKAKSGLHPSMQAVN